MQKQCNKCLITKPLLDFSKASTCKDGHRNYCKLCQKERKQEWYKENKEYCLSKATEWRKNNPGKRKEICSRWLENNEEYSKQYRKQYKQQNKEKINAYTSARRRRVRLQTPPWETIENLRIFYENCPENMTVDHIIPLHNEFVCGLHTVTNLQYLTLSENSSKGNKYALPD